MANTTLSASIIAAEAVEILDNNLVMAKQVFRGYEEEFNKNPNGYTVGDTITIRKPTDFTVRDGSVMASQDVTEASTTIRGQTTNAAAPRRLRSLVASLTPF